MVLPEVPLLSLFAVLKFLHSYVIFSVVQWQLLWSHVLPDRWECTTKARRKGDEYRKNCTKQSSAVIAMSQSSVNSRQV